MPKKDWRENTYIEFQHGVMHTWRATHIKHRASESAFYEWLDEMQFEGFVRGRSSALAKLTSGNRTYFMFLSDLEHVMKNDFIKQGVIRGVFAFSKKGANYGVKLK